MTRIENSRIKAVVLQELSHSKQCIPLRGPFQWCTCLPLAAETQNQAMWNFGEEIKDGFDKRNENQFRLRQKLEKFKLIFFH